MAGRKLGGLAHGALQALAADAGAAVAAKYGVFGGTGVVAVEVAGGKVLDQVKFNKQAHGSVSQ